MLLPYVFPWLYTIYTSHAYGTVFVLKMVLFFKHQPINRCEFHALQ